MTTHDDGQPSVAIIPNEPPAARDARQDRNKYFMNIAMAVRLRANCRGNRVGAMIVLNNRIVSTGYNGTPVSPPCHRDQRTAHALVESEPVWPLQFGRGSSCGPSRTALAGRDHASQRVRCVCGV